MIVVSFLSVSFAVYGTMEINRRRAETIRLELQRELDATNESLLSGTISLHQSVEKYLSLAQPCLADRYGPYSVFKHGFPGGCGHGITIVSKKGKLVHAYSWSCLGGKEFFNTMTDSDDAELDRLWFIVHPQER